ncbi:hypothetical protein Poli38472_001298 [Pythium oligandrum]|uniref:N-acetyltransferase domain-containing protein n=1 Tax=Pythium oligandrum TaxID=41045 RepID=A0A8K1CSM3_PYTOL|nr:hypothetical protein Poli38472_001298 [Pythium oligandrum]|eukprot:TMW69142.1 hypothetical protein Poli38472_001298 [Pythium oligandrum]
MATAKSTYEWTYEASSFDPETTGMITAKAFAPDLVATALPNAQVQVEQLYKEQHAALGYPEAQAMTAAERSFAEEKTGCLSRLMFFFWSEEATEGSDIVGYCRAFQHSDNEIIVTTPLVKSGLGDAPRKAIEKAMFVSSKELSDALLQDLLTKREALSVVPFWRGLLNTSDYFKQLCDDDGFSASAADRLEMTRFMKDVGSTLDEAPDGIGICALDLEDKRLEQVFDVLKMAFGQPPLFEAWKRHYPQQPRFAADLTGKVAGEGHIMKVYETDSELRANGFEKQENSQLEFDPDYAERKAKIMETATTGFVCGVATLPSHRHKRLAKLTLQRSFFAAAQAGMEKIILGTDRQNVRAVRAYAHAGMVETKVENHGGITIKYAHVQP